MSKYLKTKKDIYRNLNEKYVNPDKEYARKLKNFNKIWDRAERIVEFTYEKQMTNKTTEQIIVDLVNEYYSYKGSVLKSFREIKSRSFEENVERAERLRAKGRLKDFLQKYGEDTFEFNGKTKTLNNWLNAFINGKITNEQLNQIIKDYENLNPEYDVSNYRKSDGSQAILNDLFD